MKVLRVLTLVVLLTACGSPQPEVQPSLPSDPIAQMELAFEGQPSQRTIHAALDPAMDATDTARTPENYRYAGDVLVTLRKKYGTEEMSILKCMPSRVGDARIPDSTLGSVAAVCSVDILQQRYQG